MAYSTPPNFVTGQVVTETELDILSDDISFLARPPRCRVYNSADISHTTSGAEQAVTFNSERFDTDTMHSTSVNTSRLTFTTAGTYLIGATVEFASNATGHRALSLRVGGSTYVAAVKIPAISGATSQVTVMTAYAFTAGQYVELMAFQDSGGPLNLLGVGNFTPEFWATWQSL